MAKRPKTWAFAILLCLGGIAAVRLAQPAELKIWESPPLDPRGRRVSMLIPNEWIAEDHPDTYDGLRWFSFRPRESQLPGWLKWLVHGPEEARAMSISVAFQKVDSANSESWNSAEAIDQMRPTLYTATGGRATPDGRITAQFYYIRSDKSAFDRTQNAIRSSLRIE